MAFRANGYIGHGRIGAQSSSPGGCKNIIIIRLISTGDHEGRQRVEHVAGLPPELRHDVTSSIAVSYTHLDVYKRQVYNVFVARSFIASNIPDELYEAASIDGCSHFRFFFSIVLPLSPAILAVLTLFAAVGQWNSWFNAMLYLKKETQMPLQAVVRQLITSQSALALSLIHIFFQRSLDLSGRDSSSGL